MSTEDGLFKFKKARKPRPQKIPKPNFSGKSKKSKSKDDGLENLGKVNPAGKIKKRKRNMFPTKPQISDGNKKYDIPQLESKIAKLHEISEPNKKVRKKIRQLEHLLKKITQILLTKKSLEGDDNLKLDEITSEDETNDIADNDSDEDNASKDDEMKCNDEEDSGEDDNDEKADVKIDNITKSDDDDSSDDDDPKKPKRYVVFVGNLSKDVTEEEIKSHFAKVGEIKSVRIPEKKETRKSGFAFVELDSQLTYEKTLSMHHTMMSNRRINVMYTRSDPKNYDKKHAMKKNAKIDAMRKSGLLAGSVPEHKRRSFRRKKKRLAEAKAAAEANK